MTPIQPTSWLGITVLLIFSLGMLLIVFESILRMDKFKPTLFILSAFLLIGLYYWFSGDDPKRFEHFMEMQKENKVELFPLICFMAFMWMIVEMLSERGVFSTLNSYLIGKGLNASAMIFGKSIKEISRNQNYRHNVMLLTQLQKVEWNTLLFFIGIISGVAALNHVGWLSYISRMFEVLSPTTVNVLLGVISGVLDNVPVEAAALMSSPQLSSSQWAPNAMMVGIGGSLTVIGPAAGVMVMSIDKSYSFGTHLKFLPAILTNFFVSLGAWYVQFEILG